MSNVIDVLKQRGFIEQTTHNEELDEYIDQGNITCYIGFDPTASSLHIGKQPPYFTARSMMFLGSNVVNKVNGLT